MSKYQKNMISADLHPLQQQTEPEFPVTTISNDCATEFSEKELSLKTPNILLLAQHEQQAISNTREQEHKVHRRYVSEKSGLVNYLSNLNVFKSPKPSNVEAAPTLIVTDTDSDNESNLNQIPSSDTNTSLDQSPVTRRKTWPGASSPRITPKRKTILTDIELESDEVVVNIYADHREHLEQDLRARTDLDTQTPLEDLYIPQQGVDDSAIQSPPNSPLLLSEFQMSGYTSFAAFGAADSLSPQQSKSEDTTLQELLVNNNPQVFPYMYFAGGNSLTSNTLLGLPDVLISGMGGDSNAGRGMEFMKANEIASVW